MYSREDFQLLDAHTADVQVELAWSRDRPWMNPHVTFSSGSPRSGSDQEHITAVIGKNGTGKSHLFSSIVQTFTALERFRSGVSRAIDNLPLDLLLYKIDGRICEVRRISSREIKLAIDGNAVGIADLPLPRRVVALTISPFDKFPVPRTIRNSSVPAEPSLYEYLGLRDQFGKASIDTLLFKSLSKLFEEDADERLRRANIGAVFEYLDLKPTITAVYKLRVDSAVRNALMHGKGLFQPGVIQDSFQQRRVEDVLKSGLSESDLVSLIDFATDKSQRGAIRVQADFYEGGKVDNTFERLVPLRRAGFLRLAGVEVTQKNGLTSDLKRASSGQQSIVSSLLALASVITNGSLILIDEPELSLHPEWQVDYVGLLIKTFARFQGYHFVIATHSPMVVSRLPAHANIIALDRTDIPSAQELSGQSADYLLAEVFGTPTIGNLHVRERIVHALELVAAGQSKSNEFSIAMHGLRKLAAELEPNDPAGPIIDDLGRVAKDAGTEVPH